MLVYEVEMAPAGATDVVKRILRVQVSGIQGVKEYELPASATRCGGLHFNEGAEVRLSLVDCDDAGNCSVPAIHSFKAHDTIAPPTPGFGARCVAEVDGHSDHQYQVAPVASKKKPSVDSSKKKDALDD